MEENIYYYCLQTKRFAVNQHATLEALFSELGLK